MARTSGRGIVGRIDSRAVALGNVALLQALHVDAGAAYNILGVPLAAGALYPVFGVLLSRCSPTPR